MIRTRREYAETKKEVAEYNQLIAQQRRQLEEAGYTREEVDRGMAPLLAFMGQLEDEIELYDQIRQRDFSSFHEFADLGKLLIALRIANGLTQRELAHRLGEHESQVSRDERNEYYGITLERANEILGAMGEAVRLEVESRAMLPHLEFLPPVPSQAFQTTVEWANIGSPKRSPKISLGEAAVDTTWTEKHAQMGYRT